MTEPRLRAFCLTFAAAWAAAPLAAAQPAELVDLQVIAPNLAPQGSVVIAVYNDPGAWRTEGRPYRTATVPVRDGQAMARFSVPPGRYAVSAFQDKNGDGRLDKAPFGWPLEKVGYSGGERPLFGPASWDKADFGLEVGVRTTQVVRLK